jgi:putative isomerase
VSIDISRIPFSRHGSYFCFSWLPVRAQSRPTDVPDGLYLRSVHFGPQQEILRVQLGTEGSLSPDCVSVTPSVLRVHERGGGYPVHQSDALGGVGVESSPISEPLDRADEASGCRGELDVCFSSVDTVRMRGRGPRLRLIPTADCVTSVSHTSNGQLRVKHSKSYVTILVTALRGTLGVVGDSTLSTAGWQGVEIFADPDDSGFYEVALELYAGAEKRADHGRSFDDCVSDAQGEFDRFLQATPSVPERYTEARERAAYLNWSSVVEPSGFITRPTMYMSKHWMIKAWSWDHCFNAVSLSYGNPDLAWDQFMTLFDHQDETGVIPDSITDTERIWTWCKPPIHGWALRKLMSQPGVVDDVRKEQIYGPLCRWTEWWFDYRDSDGDGVPEYHHGNDSGWDNSTVFQRMCAIESADLSAHLVIQMEVLSELANDLGRRLEAQQWKERSESLLEKMMEHFWRGEEFRAVYSGSHEEIECDSLLPYVSLVLGPRLPKSVAHKTVSDLKTRGFITAHGLATELPESPHYISDGYWRGPIWAPSTMLIVDGLHSLGEDELVSDIVTKFVTMVSDGEFAENFDALTGEGLRDPAYTWTSSVFLILAHEYLS